MISNEEYARAWKRLNGTVRQSGRPAYSQGELLKLMTDILHDVTTKAAIAEHLRQSDLQRRLKYQA